MPRCCFGDPVASGTTFEAPHSSPERSCGWIRRSGRSTRHASSPVDARRLAVDDAVFVDDAVLSPNLRPGSAMTRVARAVLVISSP